MGRGEILRFEVERRAMVEFTKDEEWMETRVDHPVERLTRTIVFPEARPCHWAVLDGEETKIPLAVKDLGGGGSLVRFDIRRPLIDTPYTVRWSW